MIERTRQPSRRSFLFAVGAGGAVVAAATVASNVPQVQSAPAKDDKRATRGYRASQHVNDYYRTAKV